MLPPTPLLTIFCIGLTNALVQCVFVREYLTVFCGNEIVVGLVFAVWLLSAAAGSATAARRPIGSPALYALLLGIGAALGLFSLRFSRTLLPPGAAIPPHIIVAILLCTETVPSFVGGYVFGALSFRTDRGFRVYGLENLGAVIGAGVAWAAAVLGVPNAFTITVGLAAPLALAVKRFSYLLAVLALGATLLISDNVTTAWKYAGKLSVLHYGHEGEIASVVRGADTTVMLNNTVYRSNLDKGTIEQAVHVPASQRPSARRALVIFDRGYAAELSKYAGLKVDIVETEPFFASKGSILASPEQYRPACKYDLIFLGGAIPATAAANRFYCLSFFRHMRSLLTAGGVFSFTLPFSENYLSADERELYDVIRTTLRAVFPSVLVFPGSGYTFMASAGPLTLSAPIRVRAEYLSSIIFPSVSAERIAQCNAEPHTQVLNTSSRPIALTLALRDWLDMFGVSTWVILAAAGIIFALGMFFLPKTAGCLSVATSGFAAGVYSISLMILFQSTFGSLYSQVALLLAALTAGCGLGSLVRKFPASDLVIGVYIVATLCLLALVPQPPMALFFAAHAGMGFLIGAQFVTRRDTALGLVNAADLFGGVFGMAFSSTLIVPLFGILPVAFGILGMKMISWAIALVAGRLRA